MLTALTATEVVAHAGPWVGGFAWLFVLVPLFWILVFVLLFTFAGRRWRRAAAEGYGPRGPWARGGAEQTLSERFANGDIDEVEYRARLEVLRANRPTP
ncbi:SHOCT domain-containing protein [Agromyces sp. SYSU T00194]|uniref:SHOCT domain-containing protein n=1 Tax=Agromyces chitinivorans TaxID=3158560 RepID=UPI0033914364